MRRVVHLSDLHFGRTRPELLEPLLAAVAAAEPDLVVVSGDLTQRARNRQFAAARAFLDRLDAPRLVIPGNHDIPLGNLASRLLDPFRRYRRWIDRDLEPRFSDSELAVVGINTVDPLAWQRGRIGNRATLRAAAALAAAGTATRIVVVHHPFEHLPGEPKELMRHAGRGIDALTRARADIVLSGHLHAWRAEPAALRIGGAQTLQIQAGTGLSTRLRGEDNDFNLLTIEPGRVLVERFIATAAARGFERGGAARFVRTARGWDRTGSGGRHGGGFRDREGGV